jgi:hypothetical protein
MILMLTFFLKGIAPRLNLYLSPLFYNAERPKTELLAYAPRLANCLLTNK